MLFSQRQKMIIHNCLRSSDVISMEELSTQLGISRRTLFREMKTLNDQLHPFHVQLVNHQRKGLIFEGDPVDLMKLDVYLNKDEIPYLNKEERQLLLAIQLLMAVEPEKLIYYANQFQVSEATISNDLNLVEKQLEEYHISVSRKPGSGITVQGKEADIRLAVSTLLHLKNEMDKNVSELNLDAYDGILSLLDVDILQSILNICEEHKVELGLDTYTNASFMGLIIHLTIAIDRIKKKKPIESEIPISHLKHSKNYKNAKMLTTILEEYFHIEIQETEVQFIALYMMGAKTTFNTSKKEGSILDYVQMKQMIQCIVTGYEPEISSVLSEDTQFLQGLEAHLQPTIIRLKNHLPIYNPVLDQIIQSYHDLFEKTKEICTKLGKTWNVTFDDNEVGFITMHVGAALVRHENEQVRRIVRVGVVCASGIGVSALLTARINKYVDANMELLTLSLNDVKKGNCYDCELIVSTFPLVNMTKIPTIQINTLLTQEDIHSIQQALDNLSKSPKDRHINVSKEIKEAYFQKIYDSLEIRYVPVDDTVTDLIETFRNTEVKEALIAREKKGSAIFPDFGFGLLHAAGEQIKTPELVLLYPQDTDTFQNEQLKDIYFVIALLADGNGEEQRNAFSLITRNLIESDAFLNALKSRNKEVIQRELISIFNQTSWR